MTDLNKSGNIRFIHRSCLYTNKENPFYSLHIDDCSFLNDLPSRGICPACNKSRRYFCYNCYVPVPETKNRIPKVKLPLNIDIIKHPKEVDGKSTSAHAAIIASEHVRVFTYPDFPSYEGENVLMIFPGKSAVALDELLSSYNEIDTNEVSHPLEENLCPCHSEPCRFPFDKVVFLDSTWKQSKSLYKNVSLRALPCAVLTSHKSVFWRHQRNKPESYLSTIEAIYYFLVELHELQYQDLPYCGRYDNLLFFFKFMYYKIRTLYDPATLKAY